MALAIAAAALLGGAAVGLGPATAGSARDVDGNPRLTGAAVDLGVYEAPSTTVPGVVTGLTLSRTKTGATVRWSAPAWIGSGRVTSYRVTLSGCGSAQTLSTKKTSAKFTRLVKGVSCTVTVVALNRSGTGPPASVSG